VGFWFGWIKLCPNHHQPTTVLLDSDKRITRKEVQQLAWHNFACIVKKTGTEKLLPKPFLSRMIKAYQDNDQ
jgi:hypothetical protein